MSLDYRKLRGRIKEKCGTQAVLAVGIGISSTSLSDKLNGKSEFSQREVLAIAAFLEIDNSLISEYFFCKCS